VISWIKNGHIKPKHFITHRVHFDEVKNVFKNWLDPASGVIKATVEL
jgi:threonine dehydrogenase-like Zn-dependent dehydrogenase